MQCGFTLKVLPEGVSPCRLPTAGRLARRAAAPRCSADSAPVVDRQATSALCSYPMWPFRMPPFAGYPEIPDPGLTTGDWLIVVLTAAIAVAAVAQAFVAFRLWTLQRSIEAERKQIHLLVECYRGEGGELVIELANMSMTPVRIEKLRFSIIAEAKQKTGSFEREERLTILPYASHRISAQFPYYTEAFHDLGLFTTLAAEGGAKIEIVTTYFAHGRRDSATTIFEGRIVKGRFEFA